MKSSLDNWRELLSDMHWTHVQRSLWENIAGDSEQDPTPASGCVDHTRCDRWKKLDLKKAVEDWDYDVFFVDINVNKNMWN